MSNFDFMNTPDFLKEPACKQMHKCVSMAESAFLSNREVCSLYARRTLEIFCSFISALNGAVYPEPPRFQTRTVGEYLRGINEPVFTWIVGNDNYARIWSVNCTANSYIHAQGLRRDESYPKLIENLYEVLLWLYKDQLKLETTAKSGGYSPAKVPKGGPMVFFGDEADFAPTPERTLKQLKKAFPKFNIEGICCVQPEGDHYAVLDLQGNKIRELPAPEALENSREEAHRLRSQMDRVKHDFQQLQNERDQLTSDKEQRILSLKKQLKETEQNSLELSANEKRENEALRRKIQYLENSREEIENSYRERLRTLGDRFDELDSKYQELLPVEEQRDALKEQVNALMQERDSMTTAFSKKQEETLREIEETQRRLAEAQTALRRGRAEGNDELIALWKRDAEENARKLRQAQRAAGEQLRQYQQQTVDLLRRAGIQPDALREAEAVIIRGTAQFRDALENSDQTPQAGGYLQVVNQGLTQVSQGLTRYGGDEAKMREFLLRVKRYYEDQIGEWKSLYEEEKRKREAERQQRIEVLRQTQSAYSSSWTDLPSGRTRGAGKFLGRLAIAGCLLLALGLTAVTAVNQWRLGNALDSILTRESLENPPAEDSGAASADEPEETGPAAPEPEDPDAEDAALSDGPALEDGELPEDGAAEAGLSEEREEQTPVLSPDGQDLPQQPPDNSSEEPPAPPESGSGSANDAQSAQAALEGMIAATEAARPPESFADIPGVNSGLLEELDNMDWQSTRVFGENTRRENMEFIGTTPLPCPSPGGTWDAWAFANSNMRANCQLSRTIDYEHVKFGYNGHDEFWGGNLFAGAAVEISDVSDQLSRDSTLDDVKEVLGEKNNKSIQLAKPTAFTTAQTETAVLFYYRNGPYCCLIVCFDENEVVCDYVYIRY